MFGPFMALRIMKSITRRNKNVESMHPWRTRYTSDNVKHFSETGICPHTAKGLQIQRSKNVYIMLWNFIQPGNIPQ